ncbi:LysE family translocator [Spiractinospora alimapuensis]|uniref:LysE family translocator n=1 Tax=Spiractinospora alimapuensis TaxID=2820884 RepID=UPI001F30C571|nr:LysE family translocator [Spiractinospora alimapuensis]QVQ50728.1 LysE family translocator [Spiractinospora alimapuensis]
MSVEFLVTSLIVCVTPGAGVVLTLASGLARGPGAGVLAAFSCTLGTLPHMAAALTGLAALLQASPVAFQVLRYLGVAYLLYMAWSMLRGNSTLAVGADSGPRGPGRIIVAGILVNLLNPKLTLFFFAFLPQFVPPGAPDTFTRMAVLSGVFVVMTFLVFAVYGAFAGAVRAFVHARPTILVWMSRVFGVMFAALAVQLVVAG